MEKPRRVHEQAQSTIGRAVSIFHVILRYVKKLKKYHVKKFKKVFTNWGGDSLRLENGFRNDIMNGTCSEKI